MFAIVVLLSLTANVESSMIAKSTSRGTFATRTTTRLRFTTRKTRTRTTTSIAKSLGLSATRSPTAISTVALPLSTIIATTKSMMPSNSALYYSATATTLLTTTSPISVTLIPILFSTQAAVTTQTTISSSVSGLVSTYTASFARITTEFTSSNRLTTTGSFSQSSAYSQSKVLETSTSTTLVPSPTNSNSSRVGGSRPAFLYPSGYRSMIYHTNWAMYGRAFNVVNLQIDYISDINYAFFNLIQDVNGFYVPVSSDTYADFQKRFTTSDIGVQPLDDNLSNNLVYGNFGQFIKLRNLGKKFNFGISIGGYSQSVHYSNAMRTTSTRAALINKIMYWTNLYPMLIDRWDFDWEYISAPGQNYGDASNVIDPNDAANFGLFLASMRSTLDAAGYTNVELSACTTANPNYIAALPIQAMIQYLDTLNVMTYDFSSSSWGPTPAGHNSNLLTANYTEFSVVLAVNSYVSMGVPKSKIVIGVPFYSRGFANTDGVGLPSSGVVSSYSWESGVSDYKVLPLAGAVEMFDSAASASYSYDAAKKELLSYETVLSLKAKLRYMWDMGLKGTITWESSADFPASNPRCLTKALYDGMQQRP